MAHAEPKGTMENEKKEKQNEDNEALSTKDNEEPKSDDNLKKKPPGNDTDKKAVEGVTDIFAGLALDKDSQSALQATPIVPNALVVNARSLRKNKLTLQRRLNGDLKRAHVILVSETWYTDEHTQRNLTGYQGFFQDRHKHLSGNERGGAAIYLSYAGCTDATLVYKDATNMAEALGVTFVFRDVRWLAVCIYSVHPQGNVMKKNRTIWNNNFISSAQESAGEIDLSQTIIVGGDLNHSKVTLPGLTNYVRTRTLRREGAADTEHILDLLYTNNARGWDLVETLEDEEIHEPISDHFIVRAFSQDLKTDIKTVNERVPTMDMKVDKMAAELWEQRDEIAQLRDDNKVLHQQISAMRDRLDVLESRNKAE